MIRDFQASDMEMVLAIWLEASIKAHDFVEAAFWTASVERMRTVYLPAAVTYVHETEGIVSGFVSVAGRTLAALFVAPAAQNHGTGTKLLNHVKARCDTLTLSVYKVNRAAIGFYRKNGFRMVRERRDSHTGAPECIMRWRRS